LGIAFSFCGQAHWFSRAAPRRVAGSILSLKKADNNRMTRLVHHIKKFQADGMPDTFFDNEFYDNEVAPRPRFTTSFPLLTQRAHPYTHLRSTIYDLHPFPLLIQRAQD